MAATPGAVPAAFAQGPAVIKAWAPWCGSCRALAPHVDRVAATTGVPVLDLRVDDDGDNLVDAFLVRSVPTLIGLHDGTEVARLTGAQTVDSIEALFTAARTGAGSVTNRTPVSLLAWRGATGAVLAGAGLVFDTLVLVAVGAALIAWVLATLVRRAG